MRASFVDNRIISHRRSFFNIKIKKNEAAEKEEKRQKKVIAEKEGNVIVECPKCGEELFFDKELVDPECPYCGAIVKTKK